MADLTRILIRFSHVAILGSALIPGSYAASLIAHVEAPSVEATTVGGATTTTFDTLTPGTYTSPLSTSIGVYNATFGPAYAIVQANSYGGAGNTGSYFAVGVQSGSEGPVLLTLNTPANFFGFWWSAGDNANSISFYSAGSLVGTFTSSQIVSLLPNTPGTTVTAINQSVYNTTDYYNNPNGGDAGEPFAYVDVIASGVTFEQVAFNNASLGSGFESDNHSVALNVTGPPGTDVLVENIPLSDTAAPEPATFGLLGGGLTIFSLLLRKLQGRSKVR
ncbi:MAG TPA: PEP-CTERM sorting domain-containing protein [Bryobacteraceae bacterium]|nr:PEP-CTERM sorting domain-containing protein [Bryobacteraceae bacterium]